MQFFNRFLIGDPEKSGVAEKVTSFDWVIDRDVKVKSSPIIFVWATRTQWTFSWFASGGHSSSSNNAASKHHLYNVIPRGHSVSRCIKQNQIRISFFLSIGNLHFEMMIKMIATVQFESLAVCWSFDSTVHRSRIAVFRLLKHQHKESLSKWS